MCFLEISFENVVPSEIYIFRDFFFFVHPRGLFLYLLQLGMNWILSITNFRKKRQPLTFYLTNSELMWNSHFGSNTFLDILTFQASKVFGFKMRQPLALVLEGLAASCSWNIVFVVVLIWVRYCHKQNSWCIDFFKLRLFYCSRDFYGLQ